MRRSQAQRQRQVATQKSINTESPNAEAYSEYKSICFIQLTDYSEENREEGCFRTTFFSKIGKRSSPKKALLTTIASRLQQIASSHKIKPRKNDHSPQPSERCNFVVKKLSEGSRPQENRKEQAPKSEHAIGLIEDIQRLRYSENGYLQLLKDKAVCSTSVVNVELQRGEQQGEQQGQGYEDGAKQGSREAREEACLRLRQKIKNKQSRKHIYHSLRQKCDAWNKMRLKTQQHFKSREGTGMQECQSTRLHCKQVGHHPRNIQAIVVKQKPQPPFLDHANPLRIISKPCSITLSTFAHSEAAKASVKQLLSGSRGGNPQEGKWRREVYEDIISGISRQRKDGRCKTGQKWQGRSGQKWQERNQFRLLTPWKADVEDGL